LNGTAQSLKEDHNTLVISVDEKCGMQALERAAPDLPTIPGYGRGREFNYIRHGTQTLIAGLEVGSGQTYGQIGQTRTEEDFVDFIEYIVEHEDQNPRSKYVFIVDQLNTHKSVELVRLVARLNGEKPNLGIKGRSGILKNMNTRMNYLSQKSKRVRFVYTPKHCSWLNLIEVWFSQLGKRVLKWGNFKSTEELADKVLAYLNYYNENLAHAFKWSAIKKEDTQEIIRKVKRYMYVNL
jgi:transposase